MSVPDSLRELPATSARERVAMGLALSAFVLWQAHAVLVAFRGAPRFAELFAGLGTSLPWSTRAFFASYPYWPAIPVAFLFLSIDVLRRSRCHVVYFLVVGSCSLLVSMALHAWLDVATFEPMFQILEAIG